MAAKEHVKLPNHCEGFLFKPVGRAPLGCLIVFHERYGLVQHTLDVANRLAENGYLVLAPDLFSLWEGDKAALHRGDVRAVVSDTDRVVTAYAPTGGIQRWFLIPGTGPMIHSQWAPNGSSCWS